MANEKRLIDANDFAQRLEIFSRRADLSMFPGLHEAAEYARDFPTVDAVEVVRCKDCKWWKTSGCWYHQPGKCVEREPNDFCSDGEKTDSTR